VSVTVKNGRINGRQQVVDGKRVNVFLGIPYAEPPIGNLRFRKALPVKQWSEPIEANRWGNPCVQVLAFDTFIENKNFSEDCLYLNVWSPIGNEKISDQNLKAVMFCIHAGGYYSGASNEYYYNGEMLSTKGDVVVISINYRYCFQKTLMQTNLDLNS
jgi:cholinesterase